MKRRDNIVFFITLIISLLLMVILSKGYKLPHFESSILHQENWELSIEETGYEENIILPYKLEYKGDYKYILKSIIDYKPSDKESPYAFILLNHMYVEAFIDGYPVYKYVAEDTPNLSKSPGNCYIKIPLPKDCYGKELKIELYPTLGDSLSYGLDVVHIGDYSTYMNYQFERYLLHNIITICTIFIGVVLIIISWIILKENSSRNAWFIGLFAVIFGVYNLSENLFNIYMVSNPYLIYLINIIGFASIPVPLIYFLKSKVDKRYRKMYNVLASVLILNGLIQVFLHFARIRDLRELLIFTHILFISSFSLITYSALRTYSSLRNSDVYYKDKKALIFSVVPIVIGVVLDGIVHYFVVAEKKSNTFYMQIGIFCFLLTQAIFVFKDIVSTYKENLKGELYKSLAFKDGLTGVYNRTAYNRAIEDINNKEKKYNNLICVCVDINNLKQINDENGHEAGDNVIILTANYLNSFFGEYGKIFRLGGDEFTALLYDIDEEELLYRKEEMYKDLELENKKSEVKLCFALGYEEYGDSYVNGIEECIRKADKKMYDEKIKSKK